MRRYRLALVPMLLCLSCCAGSDPKPDLLVPVYFYQGHSVGKESRPTGLQIRYAGESEFLTAAWPELITNSVAVDESGRWVYLSCGNGVMVSRDGGKSFALTGGFRVAEVQKVSIDRREPEHAWAASAYGVFETGDGGRTWTPLDHLGLFRFCTDVRQDVAHPDTLWVASDRGVFVTRDGGGSFAPALEGIGVRRVLSLPGRILACTDGAGLMESRDDGRHFRWVPGSPTVSFCAAVMPGRPERLLVGSVDGLHVTGDGGRTWRASRKGLPEGFYVYGIVVDPEDSGHLFVCGNNGVFDSHDAGATFSRVGFPGALVQDLSFHALLDVPRDGPSEDPGTLVIDEPERVYAAHRPAENPEFDQRRSALLAHFQDRAKNAGKWPGWATAAVEIETGGGNEKLWQELRDLLADPKHSMFFSMPLMGLYLRAGDRLPVDIRDRIREVMTKNPVYRGDTENHWVMHYSAQLLAAQAWPETSAAVWPAGRSTQELYDEAKAWLIHWAQLAAGYGQGEFDSPNYMWMCVTPMFLLYDFAKETQVRQLAGMMLDLLLADYLVESLQGAYCGGHSRIIGKEVELTRHNRVAVLHYLFAGGIPQPAKVQEWAGFAALSSYRPPAIFPEMANVRGTWEQFERKRVRNVIRFGKELNPPVYKTGLMTDLYHLGSLQGGILQPIQQHTWDVTWLGSAENSTLFTVQPSVSATELGMFFPEEMRDLTNTITAQKGVYGSPDKIISASPWERIKQSGNVLLALYQVPEGARFDQVSLYWPDCLERTSEGGWFFGRDGEFWLAVYPTTPGEWEPEEGWQRYRCPGGRTGFVVITREVGESAVRGSFDEFREGIRDGQEPELSGEGDDLALSLGDLKLSFGEERILRETVLFQGPFLSAEIGERVIHMNGTGTLVRTLDFNEFTITETE